jgi:tRNA modification GTPase
MRRGYGIDASGEPFDEVLAVRFAPPRSYTGEEMTEIHCHGGTLAAQICLERLFALGARAALPGEFTKRAFLSGRIGLAEAEAVLALIRAKSDSALRAAARSLSGRLREEIHPLHEAAESLAALMEADLDFPEEDLPLLGGEEALERMGSLSGRIEALMARCRSGLVLREGLRVALVGRPNVGKSSLLNALLREARAIVTAIPGTTRDRIEAVVSWRGVPLILVDTAGIREGGDPIERIGVDRARESLREADLRIFVADGSIPPAEEDRHIAEEIGDRAALMALNKSDLPRSESLSVWEALLPGAPVVPVSALRSEGIETLQDMIIRRTFGESPLEGELDASRRTIGALTKAGEALKIASEALVGGAGRDAAATLLAEVRRALGSILGIDAEASLIDRIFSEFCIGK